MGWTRAGRNEKSEKCKLKQSMKWEEGEDDEKKVAWT